MGSITILAEQSEYWFAGVLTLIAAIIVTAVILATSSSDHDDAR